MTLFQEARSQGVKQTDRKTIFPHFLVIFRHFDTKSTKKTQNQAKEKKKPDLIITLRDRVASFAAIWGRNMILALERRCFFRCAKSLFQEVNNM